METPIIPTATGLNELVYEPAEDSFLLLDALEEDLPKTFNNQVRGTATSSSNVDILFTLEVGCGSGIISTAVAKCENILGGLLPCVFAADINPNACLLTQKTAEENKVSSSLLQTLLFDGSVTKVNPFRVEFDLILCNPPYVPVKAGENGEDEQSGLLQKSWDGGPDGNQFIIPFLSNISKYLRRNGWLYMLLSSWNEPEMLAEKVALSNGLKGVQIMKRAAGRERLCVWKFQKVC